MKILITGGLGFIGSNLARTLLVQDHDVTVLDSMVPAYGGNMFNIDGIKSQLKINISDLRDPHATRELLKGVDVVFNLAGQTSHADSMTDPITDLEINAKAQLSFLEAVRDVCPDATIVFASTRQIYGRPKYLPVDELHPIRPVDVNGVNKVAGEQFHLLYHDVYGINTCAIRLTNTYGPRMRIKDARQTFLGIWIKNVLTGTPIKVYGDGMQLRDFNYVDDVIAALIKASRTPSCFGKSFNLGGEKAYPLVDVARTICELVPSSSWDLIEFPPARKAIDIGDYYSNYTMASELLGWRPQIDLGTGLAHTIGYYQDHLDSYL